MTVKQSPLSKLSPRDISRLIFERTRMRGNTQTHISNIDPRQYKSKCNIYRHLAEKGAKIEEIPAFEKSAKDFSKQANELIFNLEDLGLERRLLRKAWSKIEKISDDIRDLTDMATKGDTVRDFGRKFVTFANSLAQLVFRDIIIDEKIDKLGI